MGWGNPRQRPVIAAIPQHNYQEASEIQIIWNCSCATRRKYSCRRIIPVEQHSEPIDWPLFHPRNQKMPSIETLGKIVEAVDKTAPTFLDDPGSKVYWARKSSIRFVSCNLGKEKGNWIYGGRRYFFHTHAIMFRERGSQLRLSRSIRRDNRETSKGYGISQEDSKRGLLLTNHCPGYPRVCEKWD